MECNKCKAYSIKEGIHGVYHPVMEGYSFSPLCFSYQLALVPFSPQGRLALQAQAPRQWLRLFKGMLSKLLVPIATTCGGIMVCARTALIVHGFIAHGFTITPALLIGVVLCARKSSKRGMVMSAVMCVCADKHAWC